MSLGPVPKVLPEAENQILQIHMDYLKHLELPVPYRGLNSTTDVLPAVKIGIYLQAESNTYWCSLQEAHIPETQTKLLKP